MIRRVSSLLLLATVLAGAAIADDRPDAARDILVTFVNEDKSVIGTGVSEPYRKRKRYSMAAEVRRHAADIAREYALLEVDRWPIRSLSVFCFVYRVSNGADRDAVIERLRADVRVESVQAMQQFETLGGPLADYDDTYASLQRGLDIMEISAAHRYSRGQGVRVAIIDGHADVNHEDLSGRVTAKSFLAGRAEAAGLQHGTAVASVIGADANNARGIVGIAPEAAMALYVACRAEPGASKAVCDSFTLAKALDAVLDDGPDVLNLSLTGPYDPLLARMLNEVDLAGVIMVAAQPPDGHQDNSFPASLKRVIGVGSSDAFPAVTPVDRAGIRSPADVYAPGEQIMVAVPDDAYDFRSGNSLAAAHVSGVVALLLAVSPKTPLDAVHTYLRMSQDSSRVSSSVNACVVLQLLDRSRECDGRAIRTAASRSTRPVLSRDRQY